MTTLVGTQVEFTSAMSQLLELEYDALEAYNAAIERLENTVFKAKMQKYKTDHEQHIQTLTELLKEHTTNIPTGPCGKQWLTKGKVVLANLMGDTAIIYAMISNELDTNVAYRNMYERLDKWPEAAKFIQDALQDEKNHKAGLEGLIDAKMQSLAM